MSYIPTINNARIAADAVTTDKVLNATILGTDIANDTISSTQIGADAVGSSELASNAVTNIKIASNAVEEAKIAAGAVSTAKIQLLAITTGLIADDAVTAAKIGAGLDAIAAATASTGSITASSQRITNLADPTAAQDAATKAYVDALAVGLDPKESVLYTTTGDITLSGLATQANATHPAALTAGDRVLVKDQTDPIENGIYVAAAGAWTRATDFDGTPSSEVTNGAFTLVAAADGTSDVGTGWVVTSADPIAVDTDPIVFTQITSPGAVNVLDDLSDVDTTGAVSGSVLAYDGVDWLDTQNVLIDDANNQIEFVSGAAITDNVGDLELSSTVDVKLIPTAPGRVVSDGKFSVNGGMNVKTEVFAADHTVDLQTDYVMVLDTAAAVRTATLPATHTLGDTVVVKRVGANNAEIATADADTIDGSATNYVLDVNYMAITLVSDGTNWLVI